MCVSDVFIIYMYFVLVLVHDLEIQLRVLQVKSEAKRKGEGQLERKQGEAGPGREGSRTRRGSEKITGFGYLEVDAIANGQYSALPLQGLTAQSLELLVGHLLGLEGNEAERAAAQSPNVLDARDLLVLLEPSAQLLGGLHGLLTQTGFVRVTEHDARVFHH